MTTLAAPFRIEEAMPGDSALDALGRVEPPIFSCGPRFLVALREGAPAARLSFEVADDVRGVDGPCGMVGCYAARDGEAGAALLAHACQRLAALGAVRVLGPMDGSTWGSYRLTLGDGGRGPGVGGQGAGSQGELPFFGEPRNPAAYHDHFLATGFVPAAHYESRIVRNPGAERPGAGALKERVERSGISSRPLDLARLDEELERLFEFCHAAFAENLYYRPATAPAFREAYLRLRPLLDPELVRLAFDGSGRLVALAFALPDPGSGVQVLGRWGVGVLGAPDDGARVVLKTIASHPEARALGLSAYLTDQVHALAHRKGYGSVIHALMRSDNASLRVSMRYAGETIRRYVLYQWTP